MSVGRRERLCGYSVGRLLLEIDDAITTAREVSERLKKGYTMAKGLLREIVEVNIPTIEVLLNYLSTTCLGVDEDDLRRIRDSLSSAVEDMRRGDLDKFIFTMRTLKWRILFSISER